MSTKVIILEPDRAAFEAHGEPDDIVHEFFTDDDGHSLLEHSNPSPSVPATSTSLPSSARPAFQRNGTWHSVATVATAVPRIGKIDLTLSEFCDYIEDHSSLQRAKIVTTECYSENAGAVTHRFLVLELRRENRKDVYLRLDRRRAEGTSLFKFITASGSTKANDRALIASQKDILTGSARLENQQGFTYLPMLHELGFLLRIVCDEIVKYRLWPANCWFFCSLIQQHLKGTENGWFTNGSLKHATLAQDIRNRVAERYLSTRDILFSSNFIEALDAIRCDVTDLPTSPVRTSARTLMDLIRQWRTTFRVSKDPFSSDLVLRLNSSLNNLSQQLYRSSKFSQAFSVSEETISFQRVVLKLDSHHNSKAALAITLHLYARCLRALEHESPNGSREHQASIADEECASLLRQLRDIDQSKFEQIITHPLLRLNADLYPLPDQPPPRPIIDTLTRPQSLTAPPPSPSPRLGARVSASTRSSTLLTSAVESRRLSSGTQSRSGSRPSSSGSASRNHDESPPSLVPHSSPTVTSNIEQAIVPAIVKAPARTKFMDLRLPIGVLIVEDNPINARIMSVFMRKRNIRYEIAVNGAEGVEKWKNGTFHLIFMDIGLPIMDGLQATRLIRSIEHGRWPAPSVIIVALTASSLQSDRRDALSAGCNDFLTKPVSLHWLEKKIVEWGSMKALQMWANTSATTGSITVPRPGQPTQETNGEGTAMIRHAAAIARFPSTLFSSE